MLHLKSCEPKCRRSVDGKDTSFSQFDGYCIFIPNAELFSYVTNELPLVGVVVLICAIARCI